MMVNGPLGIYGIVIGVKLFDAVFNILASMGVVFLPIAVMFLRNVTTPYESALQNGAHVSLRRLGISFFLWVITVMLCIAPTWSLAVTGITYQPACHKHAVPSHFGDTGTVLDHAFEHIDYGTLHLPILMAFVLDGMSGFANAAITTLPCSTDVNTMADTIDTTRLTSTVATQVRHFSEQCYLPAKAEFDNKTPPKAQYQSVLNNYGGQSDLSWLGSHVFQKLYYSNLYPTGPVMGFVSGQYPYPGSKDNPKLPTPGPSKWGYPTCQQWWSTPEIGLEAQIVALVSKQSINNPHLGYLPLSDRLQSYLAKIKTFTHLGSQITPEDVMAHGVLSHLGSNAGFGANATSWVNDTTHGASGVLLDPINDGLMQVGQYLHHAYGGLNRAEIRQEIPIMQAVLLVLALAFGPLVLSIGMLQGNGIRVIFTYYFFIGSILLMPFIEHVLHYLENSLHASQSNGLYAVSHYYLTYNLFTQLYLYGPVLYLLLMSIAGVSLGGVVSNTFGQSAVGTGAGTIKSAVSMGSRFL